MARRLSDDETCMVPSTFIPIEDPNNKVLTYHCELITPMAGGGTKSWQPDLNNPVRSQSVKGQLRFWWRTMQSFINANELKKAEDDLWGCTDKVSPVCVQITNSPNCQSSQFNFITQYPEYILFPMRGELENNELSLEEKNNIKVIDSHSFDLKITCPQKYREQVEQTITLWILFGGVGARTRKGCGALYCAEIMQNFNSKEDIVNFINQIDTNKNCLFGQAPYPLISNSRIAFGDGSRDAIKTWTSLINRYKSFRSGGRKSWPEADSIRIISGHDESIRGNEHPGIKYFPRAAFGLPIIFFFKDDPDQELNEKEINLECDKEGDKRNRWPSPVILKPTKLADGTVINICLVLNCRLPMGMKLSAPKLGLEENLKENEIPSDLTSNIMPPEAPMASNTNLYTALIRHLNLAEVN